MALAEPNKTIAAPQGSELTGLYTMFYRNNSNILQSKNFRHHGSLKEARDRAQGHCEVMGYRLNHVQPLISDLKKEEDYHLGTGDFSPDSIKARNEKIREEDRASARTSL